MIHIKDIRLLSCFVGMVLLAACQNEPEPPAGEQKHHTMELVSLTAPFLDVQKQGTTRADYENFLPPKVVFSARTKVDIFHSLFKRKMLLLHFTF